MTSLELWQRYQKHLCITGSVGLKLDVSRMMFDDAFFEEMAEPMKRAFEAMDALEGGAIANPDENRMVGHYWLRDSARAPTEEIREQISGTIDKIKAFAGQVHDGQIKPERGDGFYVLLVVGIGGSALGPQFVADALGTTDDAMLVRFVDNTDPAGIDRTLVELEEHLEQTLTIIISKSGGTKETRNGMLEVRAAYERMGLSFAKHALAVTGAGSALDQTARAEEWLDIFPMWDWVGGRTSETSAVGLLPAALQGLDIDALLAGARDCDEATRKHSLSDNPAAMMALMWYWAAEKAGKRNLVILPYADRLALLARYLQQLVMESLGKELDREGNIVNQGLTVYGNKGSTDQHAYVQQLREGTNDFFATFVEVLRKRDIPSIMVEQGATSGDYLHGFLHGTRSALYEMDRASMTLTIDVLNARSIGALVALFERAVGFYAELINVNAYHQPGVEAGKKAAGTILELQGKILAHLQGVEEPLTAEAIAAGIGQGEAVETVHHLLEHLSANDDHGVSRETGAAPGGATYQIERG
jgi:glucose-6-phosphate isomerase